MVNDHPADDAKKNELQAILISNYRHHRNTDLLSKTKEDTMEINELSESTIKTLTSHWECELGESKSIQFIQELLEKHPNLLEVRHRLANIMIEAEDLDGAEAMIQETRKLFPQDKDYVLDLAHLYFFRDDFDNAYKYAVEAEKIDLTSGVIFYILAEKQIQADNKLEGQSLLLEGILNFPHAIQNLERAVEEQGEKYFAPDEEAPNPMSEDEQKDMVQFIGENLEKAGSCDHTFRFSYEWSEKAEINFTQLAMYLNSNDGFCDCEVHETNS